MLDMNLWYCVKYIIPPTSGVCLGTGQKAHHFMYTEQYILPTSQHPYCKLHGCMLCILNHHTWRYIGVILMTVHVYCLTMTKCFYYTDIHFTAWTLFPLAGNACSMSVYAAAQLVTLVYLVAMQLIHEAHVCMQLHAYPYPNAHTEYMHSFFLIQCEPQS